MGARFDAASIRFPAIAAWLALRRTSAVMPQIAPCLLDAIYKLGRLALPNGRHPYIRSIPLILVASENRVKLFRCQTLGPAPRTN